MPARVPCRTRLLAHPRHQEDVVVDAERDEEDESEQRHRPGRRRGTRTRPSNTSAETPSAAANESTTLPIEQRAARRSTRSSSIRITRITASTSGMMRLRSWIAASFVSSATAVVPPTSTGSSAVDRRRARCAASRTDRLGRGGVARVVERGLQHAPRRRRRSARRPACRAARAPGCRRPSRAASRSASPARRTVTAVDARRWRAARRPSSCSSLLGAMTTAGVPEPPGKCSPSSAWPSRACDSPSTNSLDGTPSALSCVSPERHDREQQRRGDPRSTRGPARRSRRATPRARRRAACASPRPSAVGAARRASGAHAARTPRARPTACSAGSSVSAVSDGERDADRRDGAEDLVRVELARRAASAGRR